VKEKDKKVRNKTVRTKMATTRALAVLDPHLVPKNKNNADPLTLIRRPPPIIMSGNTARLLIKAQFGDVPIEESYFEADYTMLFTDSTQGKAYVVFKPLARVDCLPLQKITARRKSSNSSKNEKNPA
jgi:hypothetical protein